MKSLKVVKSSGLGRQRICTEAGCNLGVGAGTKAKLGLTLQGKQMFRWENMWISLLLLLFYSLCSLLVMFLLKKWIILCFEQGFLRLTEGSLSRGQSPAEPAEDTAAEEGTVISGSNLTTGWIAGFQPESSTRMDLSLEKGDHIETEWGADPGTLTVGGSKVECWMWQWF